MREKFIKFTIPNTMLFMYTGLSLVFPLGLLTLTVGPVRMVSNIAKERHWTQEHESSIEKIVLVFFFIFIVLLSYGVTHKLARSKNHQLKMSILGIFGVVLLISVYIFSFKPELLINDDAATSRIDNNGQAEFHFGGYPDEAKMEELKKEHYTAVISLLHSMVIPAEPILMEKEKENAEQAGMKLISIPMLPWIVKNDSSVAKIKEIARTYKGKYYVHCYLGKDRANVFKNIIEKENKNIQSSSELGIRDLKTQKAFERGKIFTLEQEVYYTPYPTDEEFFGFILNGKVATVVNIMDPKVKEEKMRIDLEAKIMKEYNQPFFNLPLTEATTDEQVRGLVLTIQKLKKPLVIHSYFSDSEHAKKFRAAYQKLLKK
jgi:protein tyrosine phosphatase (PTP) superfamily phosphohydrolase (DUF442 family)